MSVHLAPAAAAAPPADVRVVEAPVGALVAAATAHVNGRLQVLSAERAANEAEAKAQDARQARALAQAANITALQARLAAAVAARNAAKTQREEAAKKQADEIVGLESEKKTKQDLIVTLNKDIADLEKKKQSPAPPQRSHEPDESFWYRYEIINAGQGRSD